MTQTTAASSAEPVRPAIVSFVSPAPHSGRTSLVANLAWLVASAGHDVLVLDWDPRGSAVHEYLRPFLVAEGAVTSFLDDELSGVLNATMSVRSPAERAAPRLRRYAGAGPGESARLDVVRHEATPDSPTPAGDDLAVFLDLRRSLSDAGYDFIFLDGPPSERAVTAGRDGLFADSVVVCFQPDRESFEAATLLAVEVARHSAVRNRIIAVPGFFDDSDPARAHEHDEEMRSHLLRSLRAARTRIGPGALVQVPVPLYSLEHALVALAYEPSERKSLLEAYARLVSAVTGGVVERLPAVPRLVREVYAQRMGTPSHYEATDEPVEVIYHPADRPWGDWARAHLVAMGVPAVLRRLDGPPAESSATRVVLLSRLSSGLVNANGPVTGDTVVVRIDDAPPRMVPEGSRSIRVVGCPAEVARRRLVASFAGSADSVPRTTPAGDYPAAPRPGNRPFSVPATDPDLVDRPKLLESLRDSLDPATAGRVLLHGGASAGRTELAKSFAHRFAHGYDIVWFVPAHSRQAARSSLRRLGRQLGVDAGGDEAEAALLLLRDDRLPYLLVYDGVADLGAIGDLLPPAGSGHVVITLEGEVPGWATGTPIEVGPLTEDEAVRTLGIQLPTFRFADLRPVARAVGTAPLTLRLTAGYLSVLTGSLDNAGPPTSDDTVAAVDEFVTAIGAGTPSDDRLVDVGRLMFDRLGNTDAGRLVVTLTKICANLSPDGVSLALLRSTAFLQCLIELAGDAAESLAEDGGEIEYTFAAGARTAFFTVDWGGQRLHTHRGVQRMVQALQSGEEREEVRLRTLDALAAYAPSDALFAARSGWDRLAELARHVGPSGALEETSSREVRRWVTLHFAYASNLSDSEGWAETALAAEDVLARWPTSDRLSTRLSTHHADLLRQLGRYDEALHADVDNLADLQVLVGSAHLRASYVRRGMAGDLRGLGLFAEARAEDVTVYRTFKTLLGPDHPQTLASLHNLALSNYLDGRQEDAVVREREVFERRGRLLGPNHFLTWWSGLDLGIYLRELGRLDEARRMLRAAVDNLGRMLGAEDPLTLRAVVAEGVAQRRTAAGGRARGTISKAVTVLDQVLGPRAIETQAARMSLATDLAVQGGDLTDAIDVAREALEVYRERVGASHPFVALCRVNLGALLRQAGHLDDARTELTDALSLLDARSAAMHPWKIAGRVNLANVLLCQGACDEATTLMIDTLNAAEQILPAGHPYLKLLAGSLMNVDTWRICVARGVPLPGLIDVDVELPKT